MVSERDSCIRETVSEAKKIKKRELSANRTARVTGRHSFSPSGEKSKGGNLKRHPHFFEAEVAVPTGAQGRALRVGWEKIILALRAPVFFPAEP